MHKNQLHCFGGNWGENDPLRERRVVFEDPPEKKFPSYQPLPSPDTDPEKRDAIHKQDAETKILLHKGARSSGDERVRPLASDPLAMRQAQGFITVTGGGVMRFHEGLRYSEHHEVGREALEARREIIEDLAEDAGVAIAQIREALQYIDKLQEHFQREEEKTLPGFDEAKARITALQKKLKDCIGVRMQLLSFEEFVARGFFSTFTRKELELKDKEGKLSPELLAILAPLPAWAAVEMDKKFSDKVKSADGKETVPLDQLRRELVALATFEALEEQPLLDDVRKLLKELDAEVEREIDARFPESAEYRKSVAGTEISSYAAAVEVLGLVWRSFASDSRFDVAGLAKFLKEHGVDIEASEEEKEAFLRAVGLRSKMEFKVSRSGRNAAIALATEYGISWDEGQVTALALKLLSEGEVEMMKEDDWRMTQASDHFPDREAVSLLQKVWDPSLLAQYLSRKLHPGANPAGFSIPQLWLRSQLPEGMTEELAAANLLDIGVSTVVKLQEVWDKKKEWNDEKNNWAGGWESGFESEEAFADVVLDECLKPITKNGVTTYRLSRQALERVLGFLRFGSADAREEAKAFVEQYFPSEKNSADNRVYLKNKEDDGDLMTREECKENIVAWLKDKGIGSGVSKYLPKVAVKKLTWLERTQLTFEEIGELAVVAGKAWLGYAQEIPGNFTYGDFEKSTLLPLLNKRRALKNYGGTLENLAQALDESNKIVSAKQEMVVALIRTNRKKQEAPDHALNEQARLQQAREFLGDFAYVYHNLKPLWAGKPAPEQDTSLWIGVKVDLDKAKKYLEAANKEKWLKENLTPEQNEERINYAIRLKHLEQEEGRDILLPLQHRHGIVVHQLAPSILGSPREGGKPSLLAEAPFDIWLTERARAEAPLRAVLVDTRCEEDKRAVNALIQAFLQPDKGPVSYKDEHEKEVEISSDEAFREVANIHRDLVRRSRDYPAAEKQLSDQERFLNPLDRGVRVGLEMLQDMWAGDWVDKGKVIAVVLAGIWIIRDQWAKGKEEGWRRALLAGIPLLMAGNEMYKKQTGRDFLGEKLFYLSRAERSTALEQMRRQQAGIERFAMLQTPAGQAALRELMDSKDPITIKELLAWRAQVSANGKELYEQGAPENLSASRIRQHLGSNARKEDAYKLAFIVFESQCAKIAFDHSLGGDLETQIAMGASLIKKRYVIDAPPGVEATMLDVLISESRTPQLDGALARGKETPLEWLLERGSALGKRALTEAERLYIEGEVRIKDQLAKIPKLWAEGKEFVLQTSDDVWDYLRVTYAKLEQQVPADILTLWTFAVKTLQAAGGVVKTKGPEIVEVTIETSLKGAQVAKKSLHYAWLELVNHQPLLPLKNALEKAYERTIGLALDTEADTLEYLETLADEEECMTEIITATGKLATPPLTSTMIKGWLKNDIQKVSQKSEKTVVASATDVSDPKTQVSLEEAQEKHPTAVVGQKMEVWSEQSLSLESPYDRMLAYELLKQKIYSLLVARRIIAVRERTEKPHYPLNISWPSPDSHFEVTDTRLKETYEYLLAHYNPRSILPLLGQGHTVTGQLELLAKYHPDLWRGTIPHILLYPGIHKLIAVSAAENYLSEKIYAYLNPYLAQAKAELSHEDFLAYEAYVGSLVTNVVIETSLAGEERPEDLKFTIDHAKNFLIHLRHRRGIAPSIGGMRERDLLRKFKPVNGDPTNGEVPPGSIRMAPNIPEALRDVLEEVDKSIVLVGERPLTVKAKPERGTAGTTMTMEEAKRVPVTPGNPDDLKKGVEVIVAGLDTEAGATARRQEIFNEWYKKIPTDATERSKFMEKPENRQTMLYTLAAMGEKDPLQKEAAKDLRKTLAPHYGLPAIPVETLIKDTVSRFPAHSRSEAFQQLLNRVAANRLHFILEKLPKTLTALKAHSQPDKKAWKDELVELYRMTNYGERQKETTKRLTELISFALSYLTYEGDLEKEEDGKKGYDKFKAYVESLQERGETMVVPPKVTGYEVLLGRRSEIQVEVEDQAKYPNMMDNVVKARVDGWVQSAKAMAEQLQEIDK